MVIDGQEDPLIRRRDYRVEISATIILIEMQSIMKFPSFRQSVLSRMRCEAALFIIFVI